jgi:Cu(I)/Ag(I) efflux system membrane fusion protein/cobalt-zinc-cadmium efflux system membrane fusion protein
MNLQQHIKQARIPVLLVLLLVCGFFLGRISINEAVMESQDGLPFEERQILYWQAPMDPSEIYDRPGKSKMGMDLVPVYEDEGRMEASGIVSIDPATVQNMGVRTGRVQRLDFTRTIRTVGEVQYDEERLYLVNTKISGWIEKLYIHFVGDQVQAGDPLLEIYSPELVATQQEYVLAFKNAQLAAESTVPSVREDAEKLLASARTRLEYWDIPASEIERLERSGEVKKTILFSSPTTGVVVKRNAIEGAYIEVGKDLFEIADLRTVWVHASFYDNEVPWISDGQHVEMELSYLPGKTYAGRVSYVYPYLRERARDVHVRLIFSNPDLDLKPGMYANVQLRGKVISDAVVVPSEAVIRSGARAIVFIVHGGGQFEPREVLLGEEGGPNNNHIRILRGLEGGEEIVTSAQFMLDSESSLQEAIRKMLQGRASPESTTTDPGAMMSSEATEPAEHVHH